jgi:hypothetical protein
MIRLGDVAIIGGGCYGTFYLGQLQQAQQKGGLAVNQVIIVDHDPMCRAAEGIAGGGQLTVADWSDFLDRWLTADRADADAPDMIVPTPLMPHLMAHWLERRARREWPAREVALVPATESVGTPYDRLHTDGVRYVSFADWLCPMHCVEPLLCPAIRAPRTWEMAEAVIDWTAHRQTAGAVSAPALFQCRHVVHGVGMYPARVAVDAFDRFREVANAGAAELVIGSISSCHGAIGVLRVGPAMAHARDTVLA